MKIAIVHDWLVTYAGAERVLEQVLRIFPGADLFSVVDFFPEDQREHLLHKKAQTTFIQKLPFSKKHFRNYFPLMPFAIEQLDLRGYDLILSISWAVAKGIIPEPDQLHICLCCSPCRFLWDLQHQYLEDNGLDTGCKGFLFGLPLRFLLHKMRLWDVQSSQRVDHFIAISHFVARRIKKYYRREAHVIYPPVNIEAFPLSNAKDDFYLTSSRMVPYKKIECIVRGFCSMPTKKLIVIGEGPQFKSLKKLATPNITFLGYQSEGGLRSHMQRAKAFVFAAIEDFGIAPVEALACGTPVIAFGKGAVLETIRGLDDPHPTGCFFTTQTPEGVAEGVKTFEKTSSRITPKACHERALAFSNQRFREEFRTFLRHIMKVKEKDESTDFSRRKRDQIMAALT